MRLGLEVLDGRPDGGLGVGRLDAAEDSPFVLINAIRQSRSGVLGGVGGFRAVAKMLRDG